MMQQALFQQENTQRLLEANQGGGADNCWINLLQVLILVAYVLTEETLSEYTVAVALLHFCSKFASQLS